MEGLGVLLVLLSIAVFCLMLFFWYWISEQFYQVAVDKGYDDKKYLWLTFWLSGIGIALIIALPDRNKEQTVRIQQPGDDLPEL